MDRTAVVSLSGGLDSAVLLAHVLERNWKVFAVGFEYGSTHELHEREAAQAIAVEYGVSYRAINLRNAFALFESNLLKVCQRDIPEGHYEASSMSLTVVPGRNMIFLAILAGLAQSIKATEIFIGVHAGDHHIYPDCRPKFIHAMNITIDTATDARVGIEAPFLYMTKAQIVRRGLSLKVPFELTRTCYKDQLVACGKCGSCQERLESFKLNEATDPIQYESRELIART